LHRSDRLYDHFLFYDFWHKSKTQIIVVIGYELNLIGL